MSIALPPPITPQQGSAAELREQSKSQQELIIEYKKNILIHVFGCQLVAADHLRKAVLAASDLSDAVRAVGYVYYVSGYPATLVTYAQSGQYIADIYVRVVPGRVKDVTGPPALLPYFANLKDGKAPLSSARLEADRALADGLTERSGDQYKPAFRPIGADEVVLDLGDAAPGAGQNTVVGTFSNYGNRYAGPYLASASFRQSFSTGDELTLAGATDVRLLGLGGAHSEPYHEGDGAWSRITRFGVFGLQGTYADFSQTVQGYRLDGALSSGSATWLYPLYADFQQRLNLQGKFERDHEYIDAPTVSVPGNCNLVGDLLNLLGIPNCTQASTNGGEVLSELYNSVDLTVNYVARMQQGEHQAEFQAGVTLSKGLGPHQSAGTAASLDYFLWQPSFSSRYSLTSHWSLLGDGSFQFSNSILPQQQKFVIGGPTSAHAFEAGVGIGDHGENLRMGIEWKGYDDSWMEHYGIRPRGFVEYGSSTLKHVAPGDPNGTVVVADVGAAVDMRFTSWVGGSLSLAQSVYSRGGDDSPDGLAKKYVFFQIAAKY